MSDPRQLDTEVAERVMGWKWIMFTISGQSKDRWYRCLVFPEHHMFNARDEWDGRECEVNDHAIKCHHFTTDASAAEQVVVAMGERGWRCEILYEVVEGLSPWRINFERDGMSVGMLYDVLSFGICQAALAAVDSEKGNESDE